MSSECEPLCPRYPAIKRTVVPPHCRARAGSVLLTLSLFVIAACSGTGDPGGDGMEKYAIEYGLKKSELRALKKANKNPNNFKKALDEKKIEKLRAEGVVVETSNSSKSTKKAR